MSLAEQLRIGPDFDRVRLGDGVALEDAIRLLWFGVLDRMDAMNRLTSRLDIGPPLAFRPVVAALTARADSSVAIDTNQAVRGELHQYVSGTIAVYGGEFRADSRHGSGDLRQIVGVKGTVDIQANGTITHARAVVGQVLRDAGTGVATNSVAFYAINPGGAFATNAYGLYVETVSGSTANYAIYTNTGLVRFGDDVQFLSSLLGTEIADPAAPAVNQGKLYFRDNGAGKTQLVARFNTGAVQVIVTEP